MLNFMKIRPLEVHLLRKMRKLTVAFRVFAEAPIEEQVQLGDC
jgi:hypothetical protein